MDREAGLCILVLLIACLGTAGIYENKIDNLEEECKLNATYYEERIESYKYEIEVLSSEIETYYEMSEEFHDSGNWVLYCADNCTIVENCDMLNCG